MRTLLILLSSVISITMSSSQRSNADALWALNNEPATKYDIGTIKLMVKLKEIEGGEKWPSEMYIGEPLIRDDKKLHIPLSANGKTEELNIKKCTAVIEQIRRAAGVDTENGTLFPPFNVFGYSSFAKMFRGSGYLSKNIMDVVKRLDNQIVISCVMVSPDKGMKTVFGKLVSKSYEIHGDM